MIASEKILDGLIQMIEFQCDGMWGSMPAQGYYYGKPVASDAFAKLL